MATKPIEEVIQEKKICEIVNPKLVQADPDITLAQAIELMQQNRSGYIVVARRKKVMGIFTEVDVVRHVLEKNADMQKPLADFMEHKPICLNINDTIGKAIDIMGENRFYHIPLVNDKNELVNVISIRTLIRFLASFYPTEVYNLPPRPSQIIENVEGG